MDRTASWQSPHDRGTDQVTFRDRGHVTEPRDRLVPERLEDVLLCFADTREVLEEDLMLHHEAPEHAPGRQAVTPVCGAAVPPVLFTPLHDDRPERHTLQIVGIASPDRVEAQSIVLGDVLECAEQSWRFRFGPALMSNTTLLVLLHNEAGRIGPHNLRHRFVQCAWRGMHD